MARSLTIASIGVVAVIATLSCKQRQESMLQGDIDKGFVQSTLKPTLESDKRSAETVLQKLRGDESRRSYTKIDNQTWSAADRLFASSENLADALRTMREEDLEIGRTLNNVTAEQIRKVEANLRKIHGLVYISSPDRQGWNLTVIGAKVQQFAQAVKLYTEAIGEVSDWIIGPEEKAYREILAGNMSYPNPQEIAAAINQPIPVVNSSGGGYWEERIFNGRRSRVWIQNSAPRKPGTISVHVDHPNGAIRNIDPAGSKFANGKALVALLKRNSALKTLLDADPGTEHDRLEGHVFEVFDIYNNRRGIYENLFSQIPATYDIDVLFPLMLAIHDIGKPVSVAKGDKARQHEYINPLIGPILKGVGYSDQHVNLVTALIEHDYLGEYMVNYGRYKTHPRQTVTQLKSQHQKSGMDNLSVYWYLQELFYMCDALSYQSIRNQYFYVKQFADGYFFFHNAGGMKSLRDEIEQEWKPKPPPEPVVKPAPPPPSTIKPASGNGPPPSGGSSEDEPLEFEGPDGG